MVEPSHITPQMCGEMADSIERSIISLGLELKRNSDLTHFVSELRWLSSFDSWFDAELTKETERAADALLIAEQSYHLVSAMTRSTQINGIERKVRHLLRNPLNRSHPTSQGLDNLLEIEVASRLSDLPFQITFAEPDIVISHAYYGSYGIACKRPTKVGTVGKCIAEKAVRQIVRSGIPSFIVVGLNAIMGIPFPTARQSDIAGSVEQGLLAISQRRDVVDAIAKAFDKAIGGVVFYCRCTAFVQEPFSLCWTYRAHQVGNIALDGAAYGSSLIAKLLTGQGMQI